MKDKKPKNSTSETDERSAEADAQIWVLAWRPLKFRAWHDGEMHDVDIGSDGYVTAWINGQVEAIGVIGPNRVLKQVPVMQFTGIFDRDDKPIYEGDILKHHKYGGDHVVGWIVESAGFFVGEQAWPLTKLCSPHIEVIGNVFAPRES
jgi:hypothetical protein